MRTLQLSNHLNMSGQVRENATEIFCMLIDTLSFILSHSDKGVLKSPSMSVDLFLSCQFLLLHTLKFCW